MSEEQEEKTYSIVRYYQNKDNEITQTGLTLEEAQEHCSWDESRGRNEDGTEWMDGYTAEE